MSDFLHCSHCGDVIGVYEPLVAIVDGRPLETSRLNRPELGAGGHGCYHRTCFERLGHPGSDRAGGEGS